MPRQRSDATSTSPPTRRGGGSRSRGRPAATEPAQSAAGLGGGLGSLLRGTGTVLGQVTGMDAPARAIERLARAAERAAALLEQAEAEVDLARLAALVDRAEEWADRVDSLVATVEEMQRSLAAIERVVVDLHTRVSGLPARLPLRRGRPVSDAGVGPVDSAPRRRP